MRAASEFVGIAFVPARGEDLSRIAGLLDESGLPAEDLSADILAGFELALDEKGTLVGVAGIQGAGNGAMLRSVAVAPAWRGRGLGAALVARREVAARESGISQLFLLTTRAEGFFRRIGYGVCPREAVPASVAAHLQFRSLCPVTAACMAKAL